MKKFMIAVGFILLVTIVATNLMAWEHGRGRARMMSEPGGGPEGMYAFFGKLNLTADQKTRIEALRNAHLRDIKPLQDQMFSKGGDLKLLWLQTNPDKEKIVAAQRELRAIRDKMEDKAVAHRVDVFNILTPEQQEKARAFSGGRGPGMGQGRGGRGMMGGPCATGPGAGAGIGPCAGPGAGPGPGAGGPCGGCN